ncbi:MAG: hypothetical protein KAS89_01005 [Candidatus Eisenbacteria sp.]|nr:hypothetical protein [Candidatus Eisenbacteria bacterium]
MTTAPRIVSVLVALALAASPAVRDAAALESGEAPEGRWREAEPRANPLRGELTEEQLRDVERLRSIGYLTGSQPAPPVTGLTVHDASRAYRGLNLYTSGHFPGAVLMDMEGNVLHLWERSFLDVWPDRHADSDYEHARYWRCVRLFDNGDVLAVFEGLGLVKLDRDSRVIWTHAGAEHHDLQVADNGLIYVLTREVVIDPRINADDPILEDHVTILDSDGRELRSVSVLSAMGNSSYLHLMAGMSAKGDIFHTNAIEILDGRLADELPAFKVGSVLLSLRTLSLLVVLDLDAELVTWARKGSWLKQHDPSVLANGNILIFDNNGNSDRSRVIEFNPVTERIEWTYKGELADDFYSQMCGTAARLPNGNTLATESDRGRAIEVTPDGDIVWEYLNPKRAGDKGELVATLFEMTRLPADFPLDWLHDQ